VNGILTWALGLGQASADRVSGWLGVAVAVGLWVVDAVREQISFEFPLMVLVVLMWSVGRLETARLRRRIKELKAELEAARTAPGPQGSATPEGR
jgi:hypothetical protein